MPNLRLAVRTLTRSPFVTAVAIGSLALGIGANTAIFSLIQRVMLQSLPVVNPDGLVNVLAEGPNPGSQSCNQAGGCDVIFSYPMFRDLQKGQDLITLAGHRLIGADLSFKGKSLSGEGVAVSGSYFPVLGLKPALGRLLGPEDDRTIDGDPVVVLSYRYWTTELGADPGVLDQTILVNGKALTVVGVAPAGFDGTTLGSRPRVFLPLTMIGQISWLKASDDRTRYWLYLFGRPAPGVSEAKALAAVNTLYHSIVNDVEVPLQKGVSDQTLERFKKKVVRFTPGNQGQSGLRAQTSTPLFLLLAVTAIVLLVACTNVANLLLARAAGRASEMAVRSSLGANRATLVGQLLVESAILAVIAGGLSLLVAVGTLRLITSFLPQQLTQSIDFGLDGPVLLFAAGLALGATFLFGLLPALQATRPDLLSVIKSAAGRGSAGRGASRFRNALVTAQITLSMALLCSAGLFLRSLANVNRVDLGVRIDSVVSFAVSPGQMGYDWSRSAALFERLKTELAAIPGVTGVTSAQVPILVGWSNGTDVDVEGFQASITTDANTRTNAIGTDYFKTLGIPILQGREFTDADGPGSPLVAVVNEQFVKQFKLGSGAIGKRVTEGNPLIPHKPGDGRRDYQIVGVVRNSAYNRVKMDEPEPLFFSAARQDTNQTRLVFYVRTRIAPASVVRAVPPLVAKLDPNLPVADLTTLPQTVEENVYLDRMISTLSAAFAILATLLAAIGLYGVLAYNVTLRTREIGVRMALGADRQRVQTLIVRQVAWMVLIGGAIGFTAALGIGRAAQSLLYGLTGFDAVAFVGAAAAIAVVALGAGLIPARRASRIPPTEALRAE